MTEPIESPADRPVPGAPTPAPGELPSASHASPSGEGTAPETGDIVVDAALRDLAGTDQSDLDATLSAGESVHATLTARLSDLGT